MIDRQCKIYPSPGWRLAHFVKGDDGYERQGVIQVHEVIAFRSKGSGDTLVLEPLEQCVWANDGLVPVMSDGRSVLVPPGCSLSRACAEVWKGRLAYSHAAFPFNTPVLDVVQGPSNEWRSPKLPTIDQLSGDVIHEEAKLPWE